MERQVRDQLVAPLKDLHLSLTGRKWSDSSDAAVEPKSPQTSFRPPKSTFPFYSAKPTPPPPTGSFSLFGHPKADKKVSPVPLFTTGSLSLFAQPKAAKKAAAKKVSFAPATLELKPLVLK